VVERDLAKVDVAGSTPVSRSKFSAEEPRSREAFSIRNKARYPSGKGEVCKTFIRRFDSDPRLQIFLEISSCDANYLRPIGPVAESPIGVPWVFGGTTMTPNYPEA
jgi:hypothetical protein